MFCCGVLVCFVVVFWCGALLWNFVAVFCLCVLLLYFVAVFWCVGLVWCGVLLCCFGMVICCGVLVFLLMGGSLEQTSEKCDHVDRKGFLLLPLSEAEMSVLSKG